MDVYKVYADVTKAFAKGNYAPSDKELEELHQVLLSCDEKYRVGTPTGLTDDEYDQIHSIYTNLTGDMISGEDDRNARVEHDYPELKGTITKVHYTTNEEKRNDPNQIKEYDTLEDWIRKTMPNDGCGTLGFYRKIDGASLVLSLDEERRVTKAVTRGYADSDLGVDKTNLFKGIQILGVIPEEFNGKKVGLKVETVVGFSDFEKYNKKFFNGELADPRAAAISLMSSDVYTENMEKYLTLAPLMIECEGKLYPIMGKKYGPVKTLVVDTDFAKDLPHIIESTKKDIDKYFLPCDGIVVRWMDRELIDGLGRNYGRNTNNFETALKFRPKPYYSKIIEIIQDIGLMGKVSYTARFEPIKIDGRIIQKASLGSYDRMKIFNFAVGDTCMVTLNTVPRIGKDEYCEQNKSGKEPIKPIMLCPYCGEMLNFDNQPFCENKDCPSRQMGKIYNFIEVMKIKGIGPTTIEDLFHHGIVTKIEDLFALKWNVLKIAELDGYGGTSAKQIADAMNNLKATEAQILGSIGITGIKTKKAQLIIDQIPLDSIIQNEFQPYIISKLHQIKGLGVATAEKFVQGVSENIDLLRYLVDHVKIVKNKTAEIRAVFTGFRNPDFEAHLLKGGIAVDDHVSKKTGLVIALNPEQSSSKIKKAKDLGIPVISLTEAFERFNFKS